MRKIIFNTEPNVWISYEDASKELKEVMMHNPPSRIDIDAAVKQGKHFYQARKFPNFMMLILYDDVTGFPKKCIIDPEST